MTPADRDRRRVERRAVLGAKGLSEAAIDRVLRRWEALEDAAVRAVIAAIAVELEADEPHDAQSLGPRHGATVH